MSLEQEFRTLGVPEAGRLLGLSRSAAYQAANNGELPVLKFGKLMRVPLKALQRMMERVEAEARK